MQDFQEAICEIRRFIEYVGIYKEDEDGRRSLNQALLKLSEIEFSNTSSSQNCPKYENAYNRCCEYIEAANVAPVIFCGEYHASFYTIANSSVESYDFLDELWQFGNISSDWMSRRNLVKGVSPWKTCPAPEMNAIDEHTGKLSEEFLNARDEYLNLTLAQFDEIQDELRKGLEDKGLKTLGWLAKQFKKASRELAPACPTMVIQFFKAWKTISWPDNYETILDRPLSQDEENQMNLGGRPSRYAPLLPEYRAGLGKQWENPGDYYCYLKEHDPGKISSDQGPVKKSSFTRGLNRSHKRTPTKPEDKTDE